MGTMEMRATVPKPAMPLSPRPAARHTPSPSPNTSGQHTGPTITAPVSQESPMAVASSWLREATRVRVMPMPTRGSSTHLRLQPLMKRSMAMVTAMPTPSEMVILSSSGRPTSRV